MTVLQVEDRYGFAARLPELLEVYRRAFLEVHEADPRQATAERGALMRRHAERSDLRLVTASSTTGALQGFCYSYRGMPGQWWHDVVARGLGSQRAQRWLSDCREIVELHVLPEAQGFGVGRCLLRAALADVPERTCALSALELPGSKARRLYASEGFTPLLNQFYFPGSDTAYAVLAKDLVVQPAATDEALVG